VLVRATVTSPPIRILIILISDPRRQFTKTAVHDHGLPASFGIVFLAPTIGHYIFIGRIMTSSASSIADAVMFEACGLVVELNVADTFLMGRTPFLSSRELAVSAWRVLCGKTKKADSVTPEDAPEEVRNDDTGEDIVGTARKRFCADALWLICICEPPLSPATSTRTNTSWQRRLTR
jgi:hypothetical protein